MAIRKEEKKEKKKKKEERSRKRTLIIPRVDASSWLGGSVQAVCSNKEKFALLVTYYRGTHSLPRERFRDMYSRNVRHVEKEDRRAAFHLRAFTRVACGRDSSELLYEATEGRYLRKRKAQEGGRSSVVTRHFRGFLLSHRPPPPPWPICRSSPSPRPRRHRCRRLVSR